MNYFNFGDKQICSSVFIRTQRTCILKAAGFQDKFEPFVKSWRCCSGVEIKLQKVMGLWINSIIT